jgi:hypothetical protein
MSPAVDLITRLRARGVALEPDGQTLVVRPAHALQPNEVEALRRHKAEVLAFLARPPLALDETTLRDVLGPHHGGRAVAEIRNELTAALDEIERGMVTGDLPPRRVVRGRPLVDWLTIDGVAALLSAWDQSPHGRPR